MPFSCRDKGRCAMRYYVCGFGGILLKVIRVGYKNGIVMFGELAHL